MKLFQWVNPVAKAPFIKLILPGILLFSFISPCWAEDQTLSALMCPGETKTATYKFDVQTDTYKLIPTTSKGTDGKQLVNADFTLSTGKLVLTAGQNNGKVPLSGAVKILINYTQLPAGFSSKQRNTGKTTRQETTTINITVKPKSQCPSPTVSKLKDKPAKPSAPFVIPKRDTEKEVDWAPSSFQAIDICEGGHELIGHPNADDMAIFVEERIKAKDGVLRVSTYPTPSIAKVEWFYHGGSKIPSLLVHGLSEGKTHLGISSTAGRMISFNVKVRPCTGPDKKGLKNWISEGKVSTGKLGRVALPFPSEVTFPEKKPVRTESYPTLGLNTTVIELPEGNMLIHCPGDVRPGDKISCSIERDGNVNLSDYRVELQSVVTFTDDEAADVEIPHDALSLPVRVTTQDGSPVGEVDMPIETVATFEDEEEEQPEDKDHKGVSFPDVLMAGAPIFFGGNFDAASKDIAVTIGGKKAPVLARSPRSLVVQNPTKATSDKQDVEVTVKGATWKATLENTVADSATAEFLKTAKAVRKGEPTQVARQPEAGPSAKPAAPEPVKSTPPGPNAAPGSQAQSDDPVQQMIRDMCNATVNVYRQNLRLMVDEGWKPPKPPAKGTWVAALKYDLLKKGGVTHVRVVKSSGYKPIDDSAVQRVYQMQNQFRPIPQCHPDESLDIDHTFKVIYR